MKIETLEKENKRSFQVEHEGQKYKANIWLDSDSYKFIDWEIFDSKGERVDTEIEDEIIQYIDSNWEKL
jgi:outer membrane lipoprotein-sorting protein